MSGHKKKATGSRIEDETSVDMSESHLSRVSFVGGYLTQILKDVELREMIRVMDEENGVAVDVTPHDIKFSKHEHQFSNLLSTLSSYITSLESPSQGTISQSTQRTSNRVGISGMRLSMEDIVTGIGDDPLGQELSGTNLFGSEEEDFPDMKVAKPPYLKVVLKLSNFMLLYEQRSLTVLKNTDEGEDVDNDNKLYEYLTTGKGKIRRRSDAEAQTNIPLVKSRPTQTVRKSFESRGTYVSYFEMFDTYKALADPSSVPKHLDLMNLTVDEQAQKIMSLPNFKVQSLILRRILSGNEFESGQRRFRNMNLPNRLTIDIEFKYSLNLLFRVIPFVSEERKAVADISFCPGNGDIFAVAYGIYSFSANTVPKSGLAAVWSIKNPRHPEHYYLYSVPAIAVEFSPYMPSLLAIGLYDGSVEVRDISNVNYNTPIAVSMRVFGSQCEPTLSIKWIKQSDTGDVSEIEPFLALSQDSSVTRYRIINSPNLLDFKQMVLQRVEGEPEGLTLKVPKDMTLQANRKPRGVNLAKHPQYDDVYYVLTDEGCYYKCSTNYQHQYLEVLRTHDGAVNILDFSPWSPKLFLTCGDDWCIRIWLEGIFQPLITLRNQFSPVNIARWSPTHSTIIVALNRKTCDIWDIRRNVLKPMASHELDSSFNTIFEFNNSGNCLAIGNERGNILLYAMDEFPFEPHYQYDELEKAIYKATATRTEVVIELKSVGFFGYPNKACATTAKNIRTTK